MFTYISYRYNSHSFDPLWPVFIYTAIALNLNSLVLEPVIEGDYTSVLQGLALRLIPTLFKMADMKILIL